MNIYSEIRDYVKRMIREVNPKIVEHNEPHTPDNIGAFKYDNVYYLRFLPIQITQVQFTHAYLIATEIEISAKGGRDALVVHDKALHDATCIAAKICAKTNYISAFSNVETQVITPEPVPTNESWTKIVLAITFVVYFEDDI